MGGPVGVSLTTLDGPLCSNFILTCFSGGIVSPLCNIRSGETLQYAELVNCDQETVFVVAQFVNCSTVVVCSDP